MAAEVHNAVAIEGLCYAGKSTLAEGLLELFVGEIQVMPDYMELADARTRPHPPHRSERDEIEAVRYFLNIDARRTDGLQRHGLSVCDRSYHTLLAHVYAAVGAQETSLYHSCLETVKKHRPYFTVATLYIDTSYAELVRRWAANGNRLDSFFRDQTFNAGFRRYFTDAYTDDRDYLAFVAGDQRPEGVLSDAVSILFKWELLK